MLPPTAVTKTRGAAAAAEAKRVRPPARRLSERVGKNVLPRLGTSNKAIDKFCRHVCSVDYRGVYSIDKIPTTRLAPRATFLFILNLGDAGRGEDGHFVAVCGRPDSLLYLDPFAHPPPKDERLRSFFKLCRRRLYCSRRQIQDYKSAYCGLFALLFVWYVDAGCPFRLKFDRLRLRQNDKRCVDYLRKMITVDS
jgi:hypothetical protein